MRILLDTNVFLWAIHGERRRLSRGALSAMKNQRNALFLSTASLWEIALKVRAGKLNMPVENGYFSEHMTQLGVQLLPIEPAHVYAVMDQPRHHADPFDVMLVAQCKAEGLSIVASEAMMQRYPIPVIW